MKRSGTPRNLSRCLRIVFLSRVQKPSTHKRWHGYEFCQNCGKASKHSEGSRCNLKILLSSDSSSVQKTRAILPEFTNHFSSEARRQIGVGHDFPIVRGEMLVCHELPDGHENTAKPTHTLIPVGICKVCPLLNYFSPVESEVHDVCV